MGFFSYMTADTHRSIPSFHSGRPALKVFMRMPDGQVYEEPHYEGYGVFGGMDYYLAVALCNNISIKDLRKYNEEAVTLKEKYPEAWVCRVNEDAEGLRTAAIFLSSLVEKDTYDAAAVLKEFGLFPKMPEGGPLFPQLTEDRNAEVSDFRTPPESCPYQGFFYPEDEEACCG
jgi:hypothetical protein